MRRLLLGVAAALLFVAVVVAIATSTSGGSSDPTYKVELDNAFGLVTGEQFKVGGVPAGTITAINLDQKTLHAVVTVQVSTTGFGHFYSDAFCESRPESLIGEYYLDCSPGHSGHALKNGATIPVTHTFSTIPADLLNDVMRLPYRERLTLIINELGAGVAGNGQNLSAALERAVPALAETDNLLNLLANDSNEITDLTANADQLVTALANNSGTIERFISQADNIATDTNTQDVNLKNTFHDLPGFLEQLKPAMFKLGQTVDANYPVLQNLNSSAGEIDRLLVNLPPFSRAALPALRSLGKASVTGKVALTAAKPAIRNLNQFSTHTPELAQNLAIVLRDLDNRARATEPNPDSPGGKGYSGLEAMLQYVFNQTLDLDYYGQWGHMEAIDAFVNSTCGGYATKQTIANNLASYRDGQSKVNPDTCFSWLGKNQPGVNETDPSAPNACVADPGGAPPGEKGPSTNAKACAASSSTLKKSGSVSGSKAKASDKKSAQAKAKKKTKTNSSAKGSNQNGPPINLKRTLSQLFGGLTGSSSSSSNQSSSANDSSGSGASSSLANATSQPEQLLNYLLAP